MRAQRKTRALVGQKLPVELLVVAELLYENYLEPNSLRSGHAIGAAPSQSFCTRCCLLRSPVEM